MEFIELSALAEKLLAYAPPNNLTGVVAGGIIGNRADTLRGLLGQKLWQNTKKWYQQEVADLDVPVNATLQRAIRRSYLTSLVQTCDQSIRYIQLYENGDEYLASQRTKLQALYQKLKRTLPTLCSFPLSDTDYQIRLIEIIRKNLVTEIEQVATQEKLPDNPADTVFDQLVLWDYTHTLSERHLLLQDAVHDFVLHELKTTRGLDVPDALATLLQLGWLYQGEKQTFFELMCRNFSEEIKHEEGVSEIFNAKLLAMLREKMEVVLQEVKANQAGIQRVETQLTTLSDDVADRVVAKMASIDFNLYEKHRYLTTQLITLNESFAELTQKKQKHELKVETVEDDELRELLSGTLQDLQTKLLNTDQQRAALRKELSVFEDDIRTLALSLYSERTIDSPRLQMAKTLFEKGDLEGASRVLNPEELERDKISIEKAEVFLVQQRQTLAQEYLTKARFVSLNTRNPIWFPEALRYYVIAADLDENYKTCFLAAQFLQKNNHHSIALSYYKKAIRYVSDASQRANIRINVASLYFGMHQFGQAKKELDEALNEYQTLAAEKPNIYLPHVATTLNNLGNLHSSAQQPDLAIQRFGKALEIRRKLAEDNPEIHLPAVADTLNNLALVHIDMYQLELAETELSESLQIRKTLSENTKEENFSTLADTLNNLGILHSKFHNDPDKLARAEMEFNESLSIRRILAAVNIQAYLPQVADSLTNLAGLHSYMNQMEQAKREFGETLKIRRMLAESQPSIFQLDFASTLLNIGIFYMNSLPDKKESLDHSLQAFLNAEPYRTEVPLAQDICQKATQIWQNWGEDLQKCIDEKQEE